MGNPISGWYYRRLWSFWGPLTWRRFIKLIWKTPIRFHNGWHTGFTNELIKRGGAKMRIFLLVFAGLLLSSFALAQGKEEPKEEPPPMAETAEIEDEDKWYFTWTPYSHLLEIDGNATLDGLKTPVEMDFDDVNDAVDTSFTSHFTARKGPWIVISDISYAVLDELDESELTFSTGTPPITLKGSINTESTEALVMLALGYRIHERDLGPRLGEKSRDWPNKKWRVYVYGGARYYYESFDTDVVLKASAGPIERELKISIDDSDHWIDPVIGISSEFDLTDRLSWSASGDIAGVVMGSDLTWSLGTVLEYRLSSNFGLYGGYRVLDIDYENGDFAYDVQYKGPLLGIMLRF